MSQKADQQLMQVRAELQAVQRSQLATQGELSDARSQAEATRTS
jgi:hypothetical protein